MKKLRNALIVMLAALAMLAFVSCDNSTPAPYVFKTAEVTIGEAVDKPFAITDVFLGESNGKGFVITNTSKKAASLEGYWMGNETTSGKWISNALPAVTVDPGCSVFCMNNAYDTKIEAFTDKNALTNVTNLIDLGSAKEPTSVKEVKEGNARFAIWFGWTGTYNIYFGKGESKMDNQLETLKFSKDHWFTKNLTTDKWEDKGKIKGGDNKEALKAEFNKSLGEYFIVK